MVPASTLTSEERIKRLEDEVAVLREALGLNTIPFEFQREMNLSPQEARILGILLRAGEAHNERLSAALYGQDVYEKTSPMGSIKVLICRMRKKLAPSGIVLTNIHGWGYRIDELSRKRLSARLIATGVNRALEAM